MKVDFNIDISVTRKSSTVYITELPLPVLVEEDNEEILMHLDPELWVETGRTLPLAITKSMSKG